MSLYRLVYTSDCCVPLDDPEVFTDVIADILSVARTENARNDITGALRVSAGHFAQVLEGPAAAVKNTYGHIVCDPRHTSVRLLDHGAVESRVFGDWSMAFVDATGLGDVPLPEASPEPLSTSGTALVELLRLYVVNQNNPVA